MDAGRSMLIKILPVYISHSTTTSIFKWNKMFTKFIFVDLVAKDSTKPQVLKLVNEWYCQVILDKLDHIEPLSEATTMMALLKRVLFCYHCRNRDFIELDDLEDFGMMLDYYHDDNNGYPEVKNFEKWHNTKKKYAVL